MRAVPDTSVANLTRGARCAFRMYTVYSTSGGFRDGPVAVAMSAANKAAMVPASPSGLFCRGFGDVATANKAPSR